MIDSDERTGIWTIPEFCDGYILFRKSPTYLRGKIIGVLLALLLAFLVIPNRQHVHSAPFLYFAISGGGFLMAVLLVRAILKSSRKHSILVAITENDHPPEVDAEKVIKHSAIKAIIVRENIHRDSDDFPYCQVYLNLIEPDAKVLVYQEAIQSASGSITLALRLADRLGVPFENQLKR